MRNSVQQFDPAKDETVEDARQDASAHVEDVLPRPSPSLVSPADPALEEESSSTDGSRPIEGEYERPTMYDKYYMTLCCTGAQFCVALNQRILGPTISDLAHLMGVPMRVMVQVLATRGLGYFLGAAASGLVYANMDKIVTIGIMLWLAAVMLVLSTLMPNHFTLFIVFLVQGMALGMIDPAVMTKVLDTWGKRSGPYMQLVFIGFGLGCALTPQIARPFLFQDSSLFSDEADHPDRHNNDLKDARPLNGTEGIAMAHFDLRQAWITPFTGNTVDDVHEIEETPRSLLALSTISARTVSQANTLKYAYFICAAVCFVVGAMFMGFKILRNGVRFRENVPSTVKAGVLARQSVMEEKGLLTVMMPKKAKSQILRYSKYARVSTYSHRPSAEGQSSRNTESSGIDRNQLILLAAACLVMFHIGGHQAVVSIYIPSVASRSPYLKIPKPSVAVFNTVLWFVFLATRLLSFFLSLFIRPIFVLLGCCGLLVIVGLLLPTLHIFQFSIEVTRGLFTATMFGWAIGIAPFLASFLLFLRTFTMISHVEASALYSCGALADMAPFLVSFLLVYDNWTWLVPVKALGVLSGSLVALFIFVTVWGYVKVGAIRTRPVSRGGKSSSRQPSNPDIKP